MLQSCHQGRRNADSVDCKHRSRPGGDEGRRLDGRYRRVRSSVGPCVGSRFQVDDLVHQPFEQLDRNRFDRREALPLVSEWLQTGWVEEHGRSPIPMLSLQRQGDQIPK